MNWSIQLTGDHYGYQTAGRGAFVLLHRLEDGATRLLQDSEARHLANALDAVTTSPDLDALIDPLFADVPLGAPEYCPEAA